MSGGRIVGMLCLLAPLLSGCSGSSAVPRNQPDPLLGTNAPPIPKDGASTAKGPLQPVPALAAPSAATSPAALASGAVPKLDGDRDPLRIGSGTDPAAAWRGQNPSAVLGQPVVNRVTGPESSLPAVPAVGPLVQAGGMSAATGSIDQMMHYLESRGVKGFRLEMSRETGQWSCICSIPESANPKERHNYDTQGSPAPDPQTALRAVVEKIERDNR